MTAASRFDQGKLFSCEGLVAVVTGGGSGIGKSMALALAQNGAAKVYILGRRLSKLEEVSSLGPEGRIVPIECDVSTKDSLAAAAERVTKETGFINLVVANAGTMGPTDNELIPAAIGSAQTGGNPDSSGPEFSLQDVQAHFWKTSTSSFTDAFHVNVTGAHFTVVAFLDLLDKGNKKGNVKQTSQVVITSSIGGFHRSWMYAGLAYTLSKAAVNHLIKSLASFLIQWRIRVNGIAPGIFLTEMTEGGFEGRDPTLEGSIPKHRNPMTRAGRDEEVAGTLVYLASEAGGYCAGNIQIVDGGRLGVLPGATY